MCALFSSLRCGVYICALFSSLRFGGYVCTVQLLDVWSICVHCSAPCGVECMYTCIV